MKKQIHFFLSILIILIFLPSNTVASWAVNGDASVSGDQVILTPAANNQTGSAWIDTKIDLSNNLDISFQINLGNNDGGADGISFALHNDPAGAAAFGDTNGGGEWVGMNSICPALGIEVDTYQNATRGDPWQDHLGINIYDVNCIGQPEHVAAGPVQAGAAANIEDGAEHDFRITWDVSTTTMQVFFDGTLRLTYNSDIINNVFSGVTEVYIGYTASTGGAFNEQYIVANNANVDADKTVTPDIFSKLANPKIATYTIDIMNNGSVTAFGTQITDTLPEGVTYVTGSSIGATTSDPDIDTVSVPNRDVLSWNLSAIPVSPGGTRSISFEAIIPDTTGTFENDFTVSGDNFNQISKTVRASVLVGPSDLAVSTAYPGNFLTGSTGNYSIDVTNNGPDIAEGISLTTTLPAGLTYVSHAETDWFVTNSSATEITFAHTNPVDSGGSTSPLTITVDVGVAASPSITNSVSVASSSPDPDTSNNTDTDTIIVKSPDIDLEIQMNHTTIFREGNNGDYEIIVSNIGTDDETGPIIIKDSLPSGLNYVGASGTGWNENIVSATEINWTHSGPVAAGSSLPTLIVTVIPDSNAVPAVSNTVFVTATGLDSNTSNNTATDVTTVLDASTGNKPLYLMTDQKLSRTIPTPSNAVSINGNNQSAIWILSDLLTEDLTLAKGDHIVRLYIENDGVAKARTITVTLSSTGTTNVTLGSPVTIDRNINTGTAGITEILFNIVLSDAVTLLQGSSIEMTVNNNSGNANKSLAVHPVSAGNYSKIDLNAITVIHIENLNAYDAVFADGGSIPPSFLPGETVYIRALISDPFGSYDITSARTDIINPSGVTVISGVSMAEANDSGAAEKTYEYALDTTSYPIGVWAAKVTAFEGSENIVTHVDNVQFVITQPMPDLTVLKSVMTHSDPVNNSTNPKAIPGAVMTYTINVTNTGPGSVDTDSFVITDSLPANTELYFDPSTGPISFTDSGSSLLYNYVGPGSSTDDIEFFNGGGAYIPVPDASGFDDNITSFIINPKGTFNAYSGVDPAPSCSAIFRVRIK